MIKVNNLKTVHSTGNNALNMVVGKNVNLFHII